MSLFIGIHEMRKLFMSKVLAMLMALALIGPVTAYAQDGGPEWGLRFSAVFLFPK
jgi:hypothetical protein